MQTVDPEEVLRLNFARLVDATTTDPLWLANQFFSEGILSYQIKNELETTNISSYEKASKLWNAIMRHQGSLTHNLFTVCHVMKQRQELSHLANDMINQLGLQGEIMGLAMTLFQWVYNTCRAAQVHHCPPEQLCVIIGVLFMDCLIISWHNVK